MKMVTCHASQRTPDRNGRRVDFIRVFAGAARAQTQRSGKTASPVGSAQNASALCQPPGRMRASGTETPEAIAAVSASTTA